MNSEQASLPWYRQFWPWFIIALPASVVVASIYTVILAFKNPDSLVKDDYYREGLAINTHLAQQQAAKKLGVTASLALDLVTGELTAAVDGALLPADQALELEFIHPTDKDRDFSVSLRPLAAQQLIAQLPRAVSGRWYLQLNGTEPEPWHLKSEFDLSKGAADERITWVMN